MKYMVVGKVPKRKQFTRQHGGVTAHDFCLAFSCYMCFAHTRFTVSARELGKSGYEGGQGTPPTVCT
jgi:hypothetical protein